MLEGVNQKATESSFENKEIIKQNELLIKKINNLKNSVSFKIGRAITFIPRKILSLKK